MNLEKRQSIQYRYSLRGISGPQVLLGLAFAALVIALSMASPYFWQWDNIRNILDQSALMIVLSLGMTLVISAGGIDLSVGSTAALSSVVMALLMQAGSPVVAAIPAGLAVGAGVGAANGLLIAWLKVNPFIITLGTMSMARGLALILTRGIPIYGFPASFTWWGKGFIGSIPVPVLVSILSAILAAITLNLTRMGYYILAMGGNVEALRRAGVNVSVYKVLTYSVCGLAAAVSGLIVAARLNTAEPTAGWMFELEAIASVILGGTSMKGGIGSVAGTVIACLLLGVLRNGLTILSVHSYYQQSLIGLIILVSVVVSELKSRNADG